VLENPRLFDRFRCVATTSAMRNATIHVHGEVDISTVGEIADVLAAVRRSSPRTILLDLRSVTFFGASGINLLAEELPRCASIGAHVELETTPSIDRVLELARSCDCFAAWRVVPYGRPSATWSLEPITTAPAPSQPRRRRSTAGAPASAIAR
jgi:anti-anti-sigma factor